MKHRKAWMRKHPTWQLRTIYCQDGDFAACYPASNRPFNKMNLSVMQVGVWAGTTNHLNRMNSMSAPDLAWTQLGNFTVNSSGGTFLHDDSTTITLVDNVKNHARNSHIYYIADEPDVTALTTPQQDLVRENLQTRAELIKSRDPFATVVISDWIQAQLDPVTSGRSNGMWGGIVDQIWLSGYPRPTVNDEPNRIGDQARWCDAAGISYVGVHSAHDHNTNQPQYPTKAEFTTGMNMWKATKASGIAIYIWNDGIGGTHLSADPGMQNHIGSEMAVIS